MIENKEERMGVVRPLSSWAGALPIDLDRAEKSRAKSAKGAVTRSPDRMLAFGELSELSASGASLEFAKLWRDPAEAWGGAWELSKLRGGIAWMGPREDLSKVWAEAIESWRRIAAGGLARTRQEWMSDSLEELSLDRSILGGRALWMSLSVFELGGGRALLALHANPQMVSEMAIYSSREAEASGRVTRASFGFVGGVRSPSLGETLASAASNAWVHWRRLSSMGFNPPERVPKEFRALSDFKAAFGMLEASQFRGLSPKWRAQALGHVEGALAAAQKEELEEAIGRGEAAPATVGLARRL